MSKFEVRVMYRTRDLKTTFVTVEADTVEEAHTAAMEKIRRRRGVTRVDSADQALRVQR